ncbi:MAG: hypothetical protein H6550_05240 [Chitinophagales bacterium]|nr:hypothetical protein [Chitinophagales bacterium]
MRNRALVLVLMIALFSRAYAQEILVDSIDLNKFSGVYKGGNMGEMVYVPYFTTNKSGKKNFIIRQIESHSFNEDKTIRLELPETYELKHSAFNGMGYLLSFYDAAKKENVLMTVSNGAVYKKKTSKANGQELIPLSGNEGFILLTVNSKGGYSIENIDIELKARWEKSFNPASGTTWDIISAKSTMEGLEIIRKENGQGGKYAFTLHTIQPDAGDDIGQSVLAMNETNVYPTFFSGSEGMRYTGGYYYKNNTYTKQPDGVFMSMITMDGTLHEVKKVPYSQVIEAVKSTLGGTLASGNSSIIFSGGTMSHETQSYILTGQLISKENTEKGCSVTLGDFVTVKIKLDGEDPDGTFKNATVIKSEPQIIKFTGNAAGTNILDFGTWMQHAGLLHFKYFAQMPGNPVMAYTSVDKNGVSSFCFRNVGLDPDTIEPICMPLNREPKPARDYAFAGTSIPPDFATDNTVITQEQVPIDYATFGFNDKMLTLRKMPIVSLEKLQIEIQPDEPVLEDPGSQPNPDEEQRDEEPHETNTSEG